MEQVPEQLPQVAETSEEQQDESSFTRKGLTSEQRILIQNSLNEVLLGHIFTRSIFG